MSGKYLVEPDLDFINEVNLIGGGTLKKCFQCGTCSVICPISSDTKPFPRKEMIAASWGLKDKLLSNLDIWLCHQCGDCSTKCPRGAKPGDVLSSLRSIAISEYAEPKALGKVVNDVKKLPILIAIPVILFLFLALATTMGRKTFIKLFGEEFWTHGVPSDIIAGTNFVSTWFVDIVFVPLSIWMVVIFTHGLKGFITDMHESALKEGKTDKKSIDIKGFIQSLIDIFPTIFRHDKFNECGANNDRSTAHIMVFYGFIGLFAVTGIVFVSLYLFHIAGPFSQINPLKWLANISGITLIIGSGAMIVNRLSKKDQSSSYKDWYLVGLVLCLGVSGMLTEMARLGHIAWFCYLSYYIHLICIFHLMAFLPFTKMTHIVYRTVAMAYAEYINR